MDAKPRAGNAASSSEQLLRSQPSHGGGQNGDEGRVALVLTGVLPPISPGGTTGPRGTKHHQPRRVPLRARRLTLRRRGAQSPVAGDARGQAATEGATYTRRGSSHGRAVPGPGESRHSRLSA